MLASRTASRSLAPFSRTVVLPCVSIALTDRSNSRLDTWLCDVTLRNQTNSCNMTIGSTHLGSSAILLKNLLRSMPLSEPQQDTAVSEISADHCYVRVFGSTVIHVTVRVLGQQKSQKHSPIAGQVATKHRADSVYRLL